MSESGLGSLVFESNLSIEIVTSFILYIIFNYLLIQYFVSNFNNY